MAKAKSKVPARIRARLRWMTHEDRMRVLQGLGSLLYEDEPGTPEEKGERLIQALLKRRRPKK